MTSRDHLEQLKNWFDDYCRSFYSSSVEDQRNIVLKEIHSHNVRANIVRIADEERLDDHRRSLAEVIALFHDVGRFRQFQEFKTFKDSESVNHAALGAKVLRESRVLDGFPSHEREIIIQSVRFHNAFTIPGTIEGDARHFLKLIRDADKLDIWRVFIEYYALPADERASAVGLGFPDAPSCSPEVLASLSRGEMVKLSMLRTLNDFKLLQLSWIFDLNFPASLRMVLERDYISRLSASLPTDERIILAVNAVRDFAEEKVRVGTGP